MRLHRCHACGSRIDLCKCPPHEDLSGSWTRCALLLAFAVVVTALAVAFALVTPR